MADWLAPPVLQPLRPSVLVPRPSLSYLTLRRMVLKGTLCINLCRTESHAAVFLEARPDSQGQNSMRQFHNHHPLAMLHTCLCTNNSHTAYLAVGSICNAHCAAGLRATSIHTAHLHLAAMPRPSEPAPPACAAGLEILATAARR